MSSIPESTAIVLTAAERAELDGLARSTRTEYRLRQRARIVLLAAEGTATRAIARTVGCTTGTASKWRRGGHARRAARGPATRPASARARRERAASNQPALAHSARLGVKVKRGALDDRPADRGRGVFEFNALLKRMDSPVRGLSIHYPKALHHPRTPRVSRCLSRHKN